MYKHIVMTLLLVFCSFLTSVAEETKSSNNDWIEVGNISIYKLNKDHRLTFDYIDEAKLLIRDINGCIIVKVNYKGTDYCPQKCDRNYHYYGKVSSDYEFRFNYYIADSCFFNLNKNLEAPLVKNIY